MMIILKHNMLCNTRQSEVVSAVLHQYPHNIYPSITCTMYVGLSTCIHMQLHAYTVKCMYIHCIPVDSVVTLWTEKDEDFGGEALLVMSDTQRVQADLGKQTNKQGGEITGSLTVVQHHLRLTTCAVIDSRCGVRPFKHDS